MGGLGISCLINFNLALLAKWWWRIKRDKKCLWSQTIKVIHKYTRHGNCALAIKQFLDVWLNIASIQQDLVEKGVNLQELFERKIFCGTSLLFSKDSWIGNIPFKTRFPKIYTIEADKIV